MKDSAACIGLSEVLCGIIQMYSSSNYMYRAVA